MTQKNFGWIARTFFLLVIAGSGLLAVLGGVTFWIFSKDLPEIMQVSDYRPLAVTRVLGAGGSEGQLLGEFFRERRYVIPYDKIPDAVVRAFISAEDDKFFEHAGVNIASIIRASIANFKAGHVVQGGSTITQQVAKSLLLTPERNFKRKFKEIILSTRMERNLSKQQILYLYLNQIYLGHGAYGVQAAAKTYFRKDVSQLTLAEAAILAGLPQAPGNYSPNRNPAQAKKRQRYVLRRMYENNFITQAEMTAAEGEPVRIYHDEELNSKYAAHLVEQVRRQLVEKYGEKAVLEEGLTAVVPTSRELALSAHTSLQDGLREIDKRAGFRGPIKKLKDGAEIEGFLTEQRGRLLAQRVQYLLFMADGRLDAAEAMRDAGFVSDAQLLEPGKIYEAVVTSVDDKRKSWFVLIAGTRAELPFEKAKWATPTKESPAKLFSRGDVIHVSLVAAAPNLTVALDQVPEVQGALFSMEVQTGRVLAMEGGYDFEKSEFNRAIQAQRQPGSAFKPLLYAAALERGFTPATVIQDSPIVYSDDENGKWKPNNFEEKFYGDTSFRQSLIKSRNVPTIRIAQAVQIPNLLEYVKRIGLEGKFNPDLSISLGSGATSLYEITKAFALFPRLGRKVSPVILQSVHDRDGKLLEETKFQPPAEADKIYVQASSAPGQSGVQPLAPTQFSGVTGIRPVQLPTYPLEGNPEQVMDPRVAYVMTHLMKEVVNYGTGHGAKDLKRQAAGKTGTTSDSLDAWFMGFTPQIVTGVWVGNDSQKPIGAAETGAKAALPIWLSFMKVAVQNYPDTDFMVPQGVVFASIDPVSGKLAAPNASGAIKEAFIEGSEPQELAPVAGATSHDTQSEFLKEDIE